MNSYVRSSFRGFLLQIHQLGQVTVVLNCLFFFKVVDQQNSTYHDLSDNCCVFGRIGNGSPAAVHWANCQFDSGMYWLIQASSIVTCRCKQSVLSRENSFKQVSESSIHCFWITMSKHGTNYYIKCSRHVRLIFLRCQLPLGTLLYDLPKQFRELNFLGDLGVRHGR